LLFWRREDVAAYLSQLSGTAIAIAEESARRDELEAQGIVLVDRAHDLFRRGIWDEARVNLEQGLALFREAMNGEREARALLLRGRLEAEIGLWSKGRADLDAAASVFAIYTDESGKAEALVETADLERDLGRFDAAEALYGRALSQGGERVLARVTLGRALLRIMRGEMARAEKELLGIGGDARAQVLLGAIAFARAQDDEADRFWERASATGADVDEVRLYRGYAFLARGRALEAREIFEGCAGRFRARRHETGLAAALAGLDTSPPEETRRLAFLFLAEPRTPRSEERRRHLP
jgi:tetratricopeptide (TPR) repeat protein